MRYRLLFLFTILFIGVSTEAQKLDKVNLQGSVESGDNKIIYLQKFHDKIFKTLDSAKIKNGKFKFSTRIELPELYGLSFDTTITPFYIFLDKGKINVEFDSSKNQGKVTVKGSKLQEEFVASRRNRIDISEYIKQYPNSLVTAYILYRNYSYRLTPEELKANMELLDASLNKTQYVQILNSLVEVLSDVGIGRRAPDFIGVAPSGSEIRLYDNLTKYTLIDFWASWCGPCRKENPNVVATFEKYKSKGFSVFGVSLDSEKEGWVKAIDVDHLDWLQVSELKYWDSDIARKYGVRAIPANFLVDSKGMIVAKNIKGEELKNKVEELLGDN